MAVNTDSTVGHAPGSDYFGGSGSGGVGAGAGGQAPVGKDRSTVGSASATGSTGNKTTWASGSMSGDRDGDAEDTEDAMDMDVTPSEADMMDQDRERTDDRRSGSSVAGTSEDGNTSLVGFGEGAGSTVSGPVSNIPGRSGTITPGQRQQIRSADATSNSAAMAVQARQKAHIANELRSDGTRALGKFDFEE